MLEHAQDVLAWVEAHPDWALVVLFFVALIDSLFVIGAFIPAGVVLFAMGALVALGTLELWPTALVAATGTLVGDFLSFLIGRRYGERLFETRILRRYPDLVTRSRSFFARHGGKSVLLARFLGPIRAITPAVAGAAHMSAWLFVAVDYGAAMLWALVYILPGVVFGASLGLAADVAARLAGLMAGSVVLLILLLWSIMALIRVFNRYAQTWVRGLLDWSRRHRNLGRFGPVLADPNQPEMPALIALGTVLVVGGALWLTVFAQAGRPAFPGPFDGFVHQTLGELSTPWGSAIARALAALGTWPVYGPVAVAVLAALLWRRRLRAAAHWIAALFFGALVTIALAVVPLLPAPAVFFGVEASSPPRDYALATIVYGYGAALYATYRPPRVHIGVYFAAAALVLLVGMSRLVLGDDWASLNGFQLVVAGLWIGALTLGYRQHGPERLFAASFGVPVLAVFVLCASIALGLDRATPQEPQRAAEAPIPLTDWWSDGWRSLPVARIDVRGRGLEYFDVQWAGTADHIEGQLAKAGWRRVEPATFTGALRWFTENTPLDRLPVLPQVHAGRHARLTLRYGLDDDRQRVIRLWDSGIRLTGAGEPLTVWLGIITEQRAQMRYKLFRYPVAEPTGLPLPPLASSTPETAIRGVERDDRRLWLMGPPPPLYTAPVPEPAGGAPKPIPADPQASQP